MSVEIKSIVCKGDGFDQATATITRADGTAAEVKCRTADLSSYTKLQHAILSRAGILWRCDRIECARPRDRRREFLDEIESALAAGRQTS